MNLMHLRYFCKLAETQHYSIAANELYISQPGLSGAINSLEQELGVQLFEKKGRNVQLTKYGREFYKYVKDALNILDIGVAIAHEHSGKLEGSIDIGAITTVLSSYLPEIIADFHQFYPKIQFNVFQGQTETILPALEDSTYDVGFCSYIKPIPNMTAIPVLTQSVVAAVHKDHPLAERSSVTMEELREYDLMTYSLSQQIGEEFRQLLKNPVYGISMDKVCFEYHNEIYLAGILMQKSTASPEEMPVGLIVNVPHLKEIPDLVALPVEGIPSDFHTIYMVYNHESFNTHAINLFINFIKESYCLEPDA